jgi:hypothetical protein
MKRQEARDAKNLEEPSEELDRDVSEVLAAARRRSFFAASAELS